MQILKKETYIKMIENSVGIRLFNSIIAEVDGTQKDILNDGEFSCSCFVSGILLLNTLISKTRATVNNLEKDLLENTNFNEVSESDLRPGDIIFWELVTYQDGSSNRHVGFAISKTEAVSTNYIAKCVTKHPIYTEVENTNSKRKIDRVLRPSSIL